MESGTEQINSVGNDSSTPQENTERYKNLYKPEDTKSQLSSEAMPPVFVEKEERELSDEAPINELTIAFQASPVEKRSTGRLIRSNADLLSSIKNLPIVYESTGFQKGEMKVRINARVADTLRLLTQIIPQEEQPDFFIDNLINELVRVYLLKHRSEIARLNQVRIERERLRGELTF